jgi:CubicO group peptidase (beta-lactamase class C family)
MEMNNANDWIEEAPRQMNPREIDRPHTEGTPAHTCEPSRHELLCAAGLLIGVLLAIIPAEGAETAIEDHIERIRNALLPPVLVKGEPVHSSDLASRMAELGVPAISIAVIHNGRIEWARGFGLVTAGGAPITPDTLFQTGSVGKPITTVAALRLVSAGKLNLDMDVNQYLKSWKLPSNEFTQHSPVTLRGLLTHSAGVTVPGFGGYESGSPLPTPIQILNGEHPANNPPIRVDMTPGKMWRYSGGGFQIAQQLMTDVTGTPFDILMRQWLLRPLGMQHSTYAQPLPAKLLAQAALAHRADGTVLPGGANVFPELGSGAGLWSTPSDLARFAIAIQQSLSGESQAVLSAKTARDMLAPQYNQQALGFVVGGTTPRKYFNHGGVISGYRALLVAYQVGDGAVVMANSESADPLISEIFRTIAYEYGWPDYAPPVRKVDRIEPQFFERYIGAYRLDSGNTIALWRDGASFKARIWGQPVVELFPSSHREFFAKVVNARVVFSADTTGRETEAALLQGSRAQLMHRIGGEEAPRELEASRAAERRFRAQVVTPGSENALRQIIAGIARGDPTYEQMRPAFADTIRNELPELKEAVNRLGALESVSFKSVGPAGDDTFEVRFERGVREFHILLLPDGRIHAIQFVP